MKHLKLLSTVTITLLATLAGASAFSHESHGDNYRKSSNYHDSNHHNSNHHRSNHHKSGHYNDRHSNKRHFKKDRHHKKHQRHNDNYNVRYETSYGHDRHRAALISALLLPVLIHNEIHDHKIRKLKKIRNHHDYDGHRNKKGNHGR